MSLPWSRLTTIALAPEGIALQQAGRVRLLRQTVAAGWEAVLIELRGLADELDIGRVRFVLSGHYTRYAVLPPQPAVIHGRDWQALGEHHMRQLYGGIADSWEVRVSLQGHARPVVACAVDRALITALEGLSNEAGWRLQGVEPVLMAVFNRHRRLLPANGWLLLAEPQRLLLAEIEGGCWQRFAVELPLAGEEARAAMAMLERTARQHDGKLPPLLACYGEAALLPATAPAGMQLLRLPQLMGQANQLLLAGV